MSTYDPKIKDILPKIEARTVDTREQIPRGDAPPTNFFTFHRSLNDFGVNTVDTAYVDAYTEVKKYLLETTHDIQWDDVVGNEAARAALVEAIEHPITHAKVYEAYGMKPLKGVLLYGPPGCGKTMFGKAAASVIGRLHGKAAMLLKVSGPEIQTPFVGQTEKIIRDIFKFARLYAKKHGHPLTIFMDEADALLPSRSGRIQSWEISQVSTFLAEMDGIEGSGAFVILATNRPEAIDSALLRDGRCDRKIKVERPTREAALHILAKATRGTPVAMPDHDIVYNAIKYFYGDEHVIARADIPAGDETIAITFNLRHIVSGAMIVGLAERAKSIAFRRDIATGVCAGVTLDDFKLAVHEILHENKNMDHSYAFREFIEQAQSVPLARMLQ